MSLPVDILNIDDDLASLALRGVLEYLGCRVRLHLIATARQLVDTLSGKETLSRYIVLMGHGVEAGLYLPELTPALEAQQPYHRAISAAGFEEFVRLPGSLVLNTACSLGTPDYASAFLHGGCHHYIGPLDDPDGGAALLYTLHFFYELVRGKTIVEAHKFASSSDDDRHTFVLYSQTT